MVDNIGQLDSEAIEKLELDILIDIIRNSISKRNSKSILIFAESKKTIDKVCEALREAEIKSLSTKIIFGFKNLMMPCIHLLWNSTQ